MARTWTPSQEAAITLDGKTLLVSAAAGSGKTSVLTERIIRRLLRKKNPADLSRMLVVTFTRAAAAELKSRIASALTEALTANPSNTHLSRQLLLLGSAQISTIDSFFQKIVRSNFEQLSLPANFRIADEGEMKSLKLEIIDDLIEDFYRQNMPDWTTSASESLESKSKPDPKKHSPLLRIEENCFAAALDHLLSNRSDGKLTSTLLEFHDEFESDPEGVSRLMHYAKQLRDAAEQEFMQTPYGIALREYLTELFEGYCNDLNRMRDALDFDPDVAEKCSPNLTSDSDYCRAMLDALLEDNYERLRTVANSFVAIDFPRIKNKPPQATAYHEWRKLFSERRKKKVMSLLEWPASVLPSQLNETAKLCETLCIFFTEYEKRLMEEKKRRGILEYNDIRAILYRLLTKNDGTASNFAKDLAAQYDEVYIDEYQDVDLLQDRIFALVGEDRRFMVGDIKQSIYGFRGSDPSIFAGYRKRMPLHDTPMAATADEVCVFMSENFRCDLPVIQFANRVCAFLFSACEKSVGYRPQDDLKPAKEVKEGERSREEQIPARVVIFDAPPKKNAKLPEAPTDDDTVSREEAVWVAKEIQRLLNSETLDNQKKVKCSDIAILVQTKNQGKMFEKALQDLNIPVSADAGTDFLHEPLMTNLLNLLRVIDNPYRDLPLSEFLLSPLAQFTLEEVQEIRAAAPRVKALYDAMGAIAKKDGTLSKRVSDVLEFLENLRSQSVGLPADRFLRLLYLDERLAAYANDPILLFLYEQARTYQRTSWCGLYGFLRHIDRLLLEKPISANGLCKAQDTVTIMTIHHSKGLEFPVVFLSACGSDFNHADSKENLLYHAELGCASKLYDRASGNSNSTILRELMRIRIDTDQNEESIRTLYVALTRARERLYVTGTLRGGLEKAMTKASITTRGNRYDILFGNNYLAWIMAAYQEGDPSEFPCIFEHIPFGTLKDCLNSTEPDTPTPPSVAEPTEEKHLEEKKYASILLSHATYHYPLDFLEGLPTKAAASKLQKDLLDVLDNEKTEEEAIKTQIRLMQAATPPFENLLADRKTPSATDIGTATHAFLEFCDYQRLRSVGVDAEIERLVQNGFLSAEAAKIIHKEQLALFLSSDLFDLIGRARKIYHEQKFSIYMPFSALTTNPTRAKELEGQMLFVQGSIDLILEMEDGSRILIDYKTDRITDEDRTNPAKLTERMTKAHGTQLACYRRAVERLFGSVPDRVCIYSLPLGGLIEITDFDDDGI